MSRDGSGVYTLPSGSLAVANATATASQHNAPIQDLETDANTARPVVAGGTGGTTVAAARTNLQVQAYYSARNASNAAAAAALTDGLIVSIAGFFYKVDSSKTGTASATNDLSVDGLVAFGPPNPEHFGAVSNGSTDDRDAIEAWFDALVANAAASGRVAFGEARGNYRVQTTATLSDPDNIHIDARGSSWNTTADVLMLDLNGRADSAYADNESRQNFSWIGGEFNCNTSSPTVACAMRLFGMRQAYLAPQKVDQFVTGIMLAGKDTVLVENVKFFSNGIDILFPPWSTAGGPLEFHFCNLHHSHTGIAANPAFKSYVHLSDSHIDSCSYNLGTNATCVAVDLTKYVLLPVSGGAGTWTVGETVTGGTSGATMVLEEVYDHDFSFDISQNTRYLVGKTLTGTFGTSETVTGGTSGATATTASSANAITNGTSWTDFEMKGTCHFEAGSGANGATGIRIRDLVGTGGSTWAHKIDIGKLALAGGGSIGVELQNVQHAVVKGYFSLESGGTDIILKTDSDCEDIAIQKPFKAPYGTISLNSMSRDELDLSAFDFEYDESQATGVGGTLGAGATATASTALATNAPSIPTTIGGLYPKSYEIRLALNMPSAGTDVKIRAFETGVTSSASKEGLQIGGAATNQWYWHNMRVKATSGEFEWDAQNNGGGSVSYTLRVTAKHY